MPRKLEKSDMLRFRDPPTPPAAAGREEAVTAIWREAAPLPIWESAALEATALRLGPLGSARDSDRDMCPTAASFVLSDGAWG